jgi:hypothetical protein
MMNDDTTNGGVKLPSQYDLSNGSENPYLIEARHQLINPCLYCRQFRPVLLDGSDYFRYFMKGESINLFTYLTRSQRELLITGIHPECWDALFAGEEY